MNTERRITALKDWLLGADPTSSVPKIEVDACSCEPNSFVVNHRKIKRGFSPEEIIETAEILRGKLVTLYGEEARSWDSNFLRIQEFEAKDLIPARDGAHARFKKALDAIPAIKCQRMISNMYFKDFLLTREILESGGKGFVVEHEIANGRKVRTKWMTYRNMRKKYHKYDSFLKEADAAKAEYDRIRNKIAQFRTYDNIDRDVRNSFDWDRLGDKHDNETAHAYQMIVNSLYSTIGFSGRAEDYQKDLRDAFDHKEITDNREDSWVDDGEYLVLTDEEAQAQATEEIKESLWAFNSNWLTDWVPLDSDAIKGMQEATWEGCNKALLQLVDGNIDALVEDAIKADGRGHFVARYDNKEVEQDGLFIYRVN